MQFIFECGNPYAMDEVLKLNYFVSDEFVEKKAAKCILVFVENLKERNRNFRKEHFVEKSLKIIATFTKVTLSKFKALLQQPKNREG